MHMPSKRTLAWVIPGVISILTIGFFLWVVVDFDNTPAALKATAMPLIGIALILLMPLGALLYQMSARREERNRHRGRP